jgi:uncharacterized SAM-binding protein YcdF (DUF218 family)
VRALLALVLAAALGWAGGLVVFAERVAHSTPAADPPAADGIVALTGGSSLRIAAAVGLLEQGLAERLLISGVNPETTRAELRQTVGGARRAFDCCVDLGFQAENTVGNAKETAAWAAYHRYRSLIVVTADYHMPRALLELRAAMPGAELRAYPVATQSLDARRWWRSQSAARRMTVEYCKYLAVLARGAWSGVAARLHAGSGAPQAAGNAAS